ncbi:helix-turn-helix domain-containing protein [Lysinibacillus capsici]
MRKLNIDINHSVDKAIDILDVFNTSNSALTIEDIIKRTSLQRIVYYIH